MGLHHQSFNSDARGTHEQRLFCLLPPGTPRDHVSRRSPSYDYGGTNLAVIVLAPKTQQSRYGTPTHTGSSRASATVTFCSASSKMSLTNRYAGLERAWCVAYQRGKQGIAVGFDDGAVVIKMGREQPAASMDGSGKIIWSRHNEIQTAQIKGVGESSCCASGSISLHCESRLSPP